MQMRDKLLIPIALILVAIGIYLPSFSFSTIDFDDNRIVTSQKKFWSEPVDLKTIFTTDTYISYESNYYRPINSLSFYIEPHIFGSTSEYAYHKTNAIIFAIIALLMWLILLKTEISKRIALLCTFIFVVHPIFTPSVVWIASRDYLLMTMFSLSAWLLFINYCKKPNMLRICIIAILFIFAIGCKESAVALIPLSIAYLWAIKSKGYTPYHIILIGSLTAITVGYLILRSVVLPIPEIVLKQEGQTVNYLALLRQNILSQIDSLSQILVPFQFALKVDISPLKIMLGILICILLIIYAVYGTYRTSRERWFYALWYFMGMSPLLISSMQNIDYLSHRFLFPSVGLFIILGDVLSGIKMQKIIFSILSCVIIIFAVININRAKIFENPETFAKYNYQYFHQDPQSSLSYATIFLQKGQINKAWQIVDKHSQCRDWQMINTRAEILSKLGKRKESLAEMQRIDTAILNQQWVLSKNIGLAYFDNEIYYQAIKSFKQASVLFDQQYSRVQDKRKLLYDKDIINLFLARSYLEQQEWENALSAIDMCHKFEGAMPYKAIILANMNRYTDAIDVINRYLKVQPNDKSAKKMQMQLLYLQKTL